MPRKKITEEEVVETEEQATIPQTQTEQTPQEKAVDEIFNEQVEEIVPQEEKLQEEVKEEEKEEVEKEEEKEKEKEEVKKDEDKEVEKEEAKKEKEEAKKEEEKPSTIPDERKILEEAGLTKFKTLKDALEAYKELESAFSKTQATLQSYQKGVIPQDIKEGLEGAINLVSRPRVKFDVPDPTTYTLNDGTFDIRSYLEDTLNNYTLSFQKSLVFGELASAVYTVLSRAVTDKYQTLSQGMKIEEEANKLSQQIEALFPEIRTNEKKAKIFERAVIGAREEKKEPLTPDEILAIAKDIFGTTTVKKEEPVETGGTTGQMGSGEGAFQKPKTKEEQAVEEIFQEALNKKNTSFF